MLTTEHKQAMAAGRQQGRAVKAYLGILQETKPKRGRKRTPDTIKARLEKIQEEQAEATPLRNLHLLQEERDLKAELERLESATPVEELAEVEKAFVEVAKGYSDSHGISYSVWRESGVEPEVLKKAGITRSHPTN